MQHRYSLKAWEGLCKRGFGKLTDAYIYPTEDKCKHDSAAICDDCTAEVSFG